MKNCTNCRWADWKRTKNGRLHPDGTGHCKFPVKVAVLPMAFSYGFGERTVRVNGGYIDRNRDFSDHCSFFSRYEGTGLVMSQQPPTTGGNDG